MNEELRLHIEKLQNRAVLSLFAILLIIISIGFGMLFLFVPSYVSIIFFVVAVLCVIYLVCSSRNAKQEAEETIYKPIVFNSDKNIAFEELVGIFENLTDEENRLSTSEDIRFYRLKKIFKLRTVLYRTTDFNKQEFDNAKDRINKKANKELNISHWGSRMDAGSMMRFNIICTDTLNDALYKLISQNTNHNLTRAEGIINIVVIGNQIMIPPLYGECDLAEVSRYKGVIKFITNVLLNQ